METTTTTKEPKCLDYTTITSHDVKTLPTSHHKKPPKVLVFLVQMKTPTSEDLGAEVPAEKF